MGRGIATNYLENRYFIDGILRDYTRSAFFITVVNLFKIEKNTKSQHNDFSAYLPFKPQHISEIFSDYLTWFVGFSEGDGSFGLKEGRPVFIINQADLPLLKRMRTTLGFGTVITYHQYGSIYARYAVYDKQSIERIIHIFNGNIQLKKVHSRFVRWVQKYNELYAEDGKEIVIKPCRNANQITLDSYWLAGFMDAEGGFSSSMAANKRANVQKERNSASNYTRLYLKGYVDQKSELEVMQQISTLLYVRNVTIRNAEKQYHRVEVTTQINIPILLNYLEKYKLKSKKRLAYEIWKDIANLYINNQHYQDMKVLLKKVEKVKQLNAAFSIEKSVLKTLSFEDEETIV
jgi:hypothetical protein